MPRVFYLEPFVGSLAYGYYMPLTLANDCLPGHMCLCMADQGIAVFEDIAKKDGITSIDFSQFADVEPQAVRCAAGRQRNITDPSSLIAD